jgi:hypothetical protein
MNNTGRNETQIWVNPGRVLGPPIPPADNVSKPQTQVLAMLKTPQMSRWMNLFMVFLSLLSS